MKSEQEKQTQLLRDVRAVLCPGIVLLKAGFWIAVSVMAFGILASFAGVFKG